MIAPTLRTESETDRIALRGLRLHGELRGMSQRVTLEQVFVNGEDRDLEAVYTFPLPEQAAVCGFEIATGDRTLSGQIEENEEAAELYDEAISDGHGAYTLEQDRPDVFSVQVGNLRPGQAASIKVIYVAPIEVVDRELRLTFPTTIAPRYMSSMGMDGRDMLIEDDVLNPPHVLRVPYGLSMELDVELGRPVRRVDSPTHRLHSEPTASGGVRVTLAEGETEPDRDLVVRLELDREAEPWGQSSTGPGEQSFAAVTFVPELDDRATTPPEPVEVFFLLDCSGSMCGSSIEDAKAALELCLRSLSDGDRFNVCRFGSTHEFMHADSVRYTPRTLERSLEWLDGVEADLGGTEILGPLSAVLERPSPVARARHIVLITDGEVGNEQAIIDAARRHRDRNRIFSFAIGSAPSAFLIRGVARVSGGASEFVAPGETVREKVLRMFNRMASPVVEEIRIDWGSGTTVRVAPADAPTIFDGEAVTVFGRCDGPVPASVTLHATTMEGARSWSVELPQPVDDGGLLATLWARHAIRDFEEEHGEALVGSRWRGRPPHGSRRLVELSKQYGIMSSHTTFIAVEKRVEGERAGGVPVTRRVPVMLARGWHGIAVRGEHAFGFMRPQSMGMTDGREHFAVLHSVMPSMDRQAAAGPDDDLYLVLSGQTAGGWFDDFDVHGLSPLDVHAHRTAVVTALSSRGIDASHGQYQAIVHTLVAILLLRTEFADRHDLWRRAERKARRWLATTLGEDMDSVGAFVECIEGSAV